MSPRKTASPKRTISVESTAEAYLELLRDRGIEYFFGNGGTDFAPIIEAFAKFAAEGKTTPRPITVPHEFVAGPPVVPRWSWSTPSWGRRTPPVPS
jgi:hypothetical protein